MAAISKTENVSYTLELTYSEFSLLKALLQNPHPEYMNHETTVDMCKELFEQFAEVDNGGLNL